MRETSNVAIALFGEELAELCPVLNVLEERINTHCKAAFDATIILSHDIVNSLGDELTTLGMAIHTIQERMDAYERDHIKDMPNMVELHATLFAMIMQQRILEDRVRRISLTLQERPKVRRHRELIQCFESSSSTLDNVPEVVNNPELPKTQPHCVFHEKELEHDVHPLIKAPCRVPPLESEELKMQFKELSPDGDSFSTIDNKQEVVNTHELPPTSPPHPALATECLKPQCDASPFPTHDNLAIQQNGILSMNAITKPAPKMQFHHVLHKESLQHFLTDLPKLVMGVFRRPCYLPTLEYQIIWEDFQGEYHIDRLSKFYGYFKTRLKNFARRGRRQNRWGRMSRPHIFEHNTGTDFMHTEAYSASSVSRNTLEHGGMVRSSLECGGTLLTSLEHARLL